MSNGRMNRLFPDDFIENQRMFGVRRTFSKNVHGVPDRAGRFYRAPIDPATEAAREYQLESYDTRMRLATYGSRPKIAQIDDTNDFTSRRHYAPSLDWLIRNEETKLAELDVRRNFIDYKIRPKPSSLFAPKPEEGS